ncbi:uncharacterized protein L969DRAFT_89171 [Mixia osmundae IAM 14324]|uniref:DH domain-containing protein n=1 Tax=Mixia osmundae (strain CBS 9802 / IAM 14324 / JCM 22182 / KY 12970) TaxID=764103 RepID=G7DSK6_MIXOS|nr:uncharacterized protein L969DRAFT_89171 [Mixia osmundae IAM 14324]KEI37937.1 hypothetical protein L969DRAFT_89171 [Mixia osmundae IAM 14324]GAA93566.1 hypothetical protein E5Q_00210 [Mixia osmundae IAM 14324]
MQHQASTNCQRHSRPSSTVAAEQRDSLVSLWRADPTAEIVQPESLAQCCSVVTRSPSRVSKSPSGSSRRRRHKRVSSDLMSGFAHADRLAHEQQQHRLATPSRPSRVYGPLSPDGSPSSPIGTSKRAAKAIHRKPIVYPDDIPPQPGSPRPRESTAEQEVLAWSASLKSDLTAYLRAGELISAKNWDDLPSLSISPGQIDKAGSPAQPSTVKQRRTKERPRKIKIGNPQPESIKTPGLIYAPTPALKDELPLLTPIKSATSSQGKLHIEPKRNSRASPGSELEGSPVMIDFEEARCLPTLANSPTSATTKKSRNPFRSRTSSRTTTKPDNLVALLPVRINAKRSNSTLSQASSNASQSASMTISSTVTSMRMKPKMLTKALLAIDRPLQPQLPGASPIAPHSPHFSKTPTSPRRYSEPPDVIINPPAGPDVPPRKSSRSRVQRHSSPTNAQDDPPVEKVTTGQKHRRLNSFASQRARAESLNPIDERKAKEVAFAQPLPFPGRAPTPLGERDSNRALIQLTEFLGLDVVPTATKPPPVQKSFSINPFRHHKESQLGQADSTSLNRKASTRSVRSFTTKSDVQRPSRPSSRADDARPMSIYSDASGSRDRRRSVTPLAGVSIPASQSRDRLNAALDGPATTAPTDDTTIRAAATWASLVEDEDLLNNISSTERMRQEIITEIVQTEQRYLGDLMSIQTIYIEPLLPHLRYIAPDAEATTAPQRQSQAESDSGNALWPQNLAEFYPSTADSNGRDSAVGELPIASLYSRRSSSSLSYQQQAYKINMVDQIRSSLDMPEIESEHSSPKPDSLSGRASDNLPAMKGPAAASERSRAVTNPPKKLQRTRKMQQATPIIAVPSNLEQILTVLSNELLPRHVKIAGLLKDRYCQQFPLVRSLSEIYAQNNDIYEHYATFTVSLTEALHDVEAALASLQKTKSPLRAFGQRMQELEAEANRQGESALRIALAKPFQRMLKMPMLFKNLLAHTDEALPEHEHLSTLCNQIDAVLKSIQEEKLNAEEGLKVSDVLARIAGINDKNLLAPSPARVLLAEMPVVPPVAVPESFPNILQSALFRTADDDRAAPTRRMSGPKSQQASGKDSWLVVFNDVVIRCRRTGSTQTRIGHYQQSGSAYEGPKRHTYRFEAVESWTATTRPQRAVSSYYAQQRNSLLSPVPSMIPCDPPEENDEVDDMAGELVMPTPKRSFTGLTATNRSASAPPNSYGVSFPQGQKSGDDRFERVNARTHSEPIPKPSIQTGRLKLATSSPYGSPRRPVSSPQWSEEEKSATPSHPGAMLANAFYGN